MFLHQEKNAPKSLLTGKKNAIKIWAGKVAKYWRGSRKNVKVLDEGSVFSNGK